MARAVLRGWEWQAGAQQQVAQQQVAQPDMELYRIPEEAYRGQTAAIHRSHQEHWAAACRAAP